MSWDIELVRCKYVTLIKLNRNKCIEIKLIYHAKLMSISKQYSISVLGDKILDFSFIVKCSRGLLIWPPSD